MSMLLDSLVFVGATGAAGYAMAATVGPNLAKIRGALDGGPQDFALVRAERLIAVRRWATPPRVEAVRLREAA